MSTSEIGRVQQHSLPCIFYSLVRNSMILVIGCTYIFILQWYMHTYETYSLFILCNDHHNHFFWIEVHMTNMEVILCNGSVTINETVLLPGILVFPDLFHHSSLSIQKNAKYFFKDGTIERYNTIWRSIIIVITMKAPNDYNIDKYIWSMWDEHHHRHFSQRFTSHYNIFTFLVCVPSSKKCRCIF